MLYCLKTFQWLFGDESGISYKECLDAKTLKMGKSILKLEKVLSYSDYFKYETK